MNQITIRRAKRADVPAILEIYNDAVLQTTASADYEPRTLASRLEWFREHQKKKYPIFVAQNSQRKIVGWSSLSQYHQRIGYRFTAENSVYVASDWRGQGIGAQLLAPLIDDARKLGLHVIIASISADNEASIRLHAAFGFKQVAVMKEIIYKFDRWLDVVFMELVLTS